MAIDFPNTPTLNQAFTSGGLSWTWDGTKWNMTAVAGGPYVPLSGGTLTGDLILNRDPQVALGAATKNYVDDVIAGDNRIINGDMRIDQRNGGASGTAVGYTVDRWFYTATQAAKGGWQRVANPPSALLGFPYALAFTSTSAYALLSTDYFQFQQRIEADLVSDFAFGTVAAQPVTLSFWAAPSISGNFSGSICNATGDRNYPFSFALNSGAWTKVAVTIPGDTTGNWAMSGNGMGVIVRFDLGSGANFRGPANTWQANNSVGVTGAVSVVGTNGASFSVTGVKLEVGSIATPFNRQSLTKSFADCQRYYQTFPSPIISGYNSATGPIIGGTMMLPAAMRATPTVGLGAPNYSNASALVTGAVDYASVRLNATITATGMGWAAAQPLTLTAEL
jgi:hypothetical protein